MMKTVITMAIMKNLMIMMVVMLLLIKKKAKKGLSFFFILADLQLARVSNLA